MRRRRRPTELLLNLDSLVDIVSNSVGILLILTVFMAIFALVHQRLSEENPQKNTEVAEDTQKIVIPWAKYSQKTSHVFLLRDQRLLYFDRVHVYEQLSQQLKQGGEAPTHLDFPEYSVEFATYSLSAHCLEFIARPRSGEEWHRATRAEAPFQQLMQKSAPNEYYFFFWVDADSFELFRDVRAYLWEHHFEVGWKPVIERSLLQACSGAWPAMSFQPQ